MRTSFRRPSLKKGTADVSSQTGRFLDREPGDAVASLHVDGKRIGALAEREIAMRWNLERTGIYVAVNYIGMLDEFAVFRRALSDQEIAVLHRSPGVLADLKTSPARD